MNTLNGGIADDSLYYVTQIQGCEYAGMAYIGTNNHGIALLSTGSTIFQYDTAGYTSSGRATFRQSKLYADYYQNYSYYQSIFVTDNGINFLQTGCVGEGIKETGNELNPIAWYQQDDDKLRIQLPIAYSGPTIVEMYDMSGRLISSSTQNIITDNKVYINISGMATGVYVLHTSNGANSDQSKIIISK